MQSGSIKPWFYQANSIKFHWSQQDFCQKAGISVVPGCCYTGSQHRNWDFPGSSHLHPPLFLSRSAFFLLIMIFLLHTMIFKLPAVTFPEEELLLVFITGRIPSSSLTPKSSSVSPAYVEITSVHISLQQQCHETQILSSVTLHHPGSTFKTWATGRHWGILQPESLQTHNSKALFVVFFFF